MFGVLLLLTACDTSKKYETVPDDANVYIVDSAVVYSSYVLFHLRDVEDEFATPITKCLDGIDYPRGTIIVINDDAYVQKISKVNQQELLHNVLLVALLAIALMLIAQRTVAKEKQKNSGK